MRELKTFESFSNFDDVWGELNDIIKANTSFIKPEQYGFGKTGIVASFQWKGERWVLNFDSNNNKPYGIKKPKKTTIHFDKKGFYKELEKIGII